MQLFHFKLAQFCSLSCLLFLGTVYCGAFRKCWYFYKCLQTMKYCVAILEIKYCGNRIQIGLQWRQARRNNSPPKKGTLLLCFILVPASARERVGWYIERTATIALTSFHCGAFTLFSYYTENRMPGFQSISFICSNSGALRAKKVWNEIFLPSCLFIGFALQRLRS